MQFYCRLVVSDWVAEPGVNIEGLTNCRDGKSFPQMIVMSFNYPIGYPTSPMERVVQPRDVTGHGVVVPHDWVQSTHRRLTHRCARQLKKTKSLLLPQLPHTMDPTFEPPPAVAQNGSLGVNLCLSTRRDHGANTGSKPQPRAKPS